MATVVKCDYCPETLKGGYLIKNHYAEKHPGMEILLPNVEKFLCKEDGCDTIFFWQIKNGSTSTKSSWKTVRYNQETMS